MADTNPNLLHALVLDRAGGCSKSDYRSIQNWSREQGVLWVHVNIADAASCRWLEDHAGLPPVAREGLLAEETRPRSIVTEQGLLIVLRGVNLNPGADPEDMVSVRVWLEPDRIISSRRRKLLSILDIVAALEAGDGPRAPDQFLAMLVERLADRIGAFVESIDDRIEAAEDEIVIAKAGSFRQKLAALRRQIAHVRRFLAPQRDALDRLNRNPGKIIDDATAHMLRQESDRITRYLEDLDLAKERAVVLQEEHLSQIAQEQNTRMYVLSIVAAIFLPLTFVTGLLGMNVGGLPGLESPWGFVSSLIIMIVAATGLLLFFRWKKWL